MGNKTQNKYPGAYLDKDEEVVPVVRSLYRFFNVDQIAQDCPESWDFMFEELETQKLHREFYELHPGARKYFQNR